MEKTDISAKIGFLETSLLSLDQGFPGALFRVAIGFATPPVLERLQGNQGSGWVLVPGLLVVLLLLRILPLTIRRLAPFSRAAQEIWAERRQMAKRYDSYQWQKLLWIGAGIALHTALSGAMSPSRIVVSSICILIGGIGLARWRVVAPRRPNSTAPSLKETRTVA